MRLSGIDLNLLVVLDALLTESNVTRAARRVGLSQSATSHALARLREHFDDPILLRTSAGMVPTARARALGPAVRGVVEGAEALFLGPDEFEPASSREVFQVGLEEAAQLTVLPRLVESVQAAAPNSLLRVVRMRPDDMVAAFEAGNIDAAVTPFVPPPGSALRSELLLTTDYVSIARAGHPGVGQRLTRKRFLELPHVTVSHPSLADTPIDQILARSDEARRIVATVPSPVAIPFLVANTDLVATLPEMLLDMAGPWSSALKRYRSPVELEPVAVYLVHHQRSEGSHAQRWLRDQLRAVLADMS